MPKITTLPFHDTGKNIPGQEKRFQDSKNFCRNFLINSE
jgi:hypothetical protein